ncbi:MAG: TolC family protein [Litorimonas sp.]
MTELEATLRLHPSLEAYALRADAQRERAEAETALPDPEVTMGLNNFPVFDPSFTEYLPTNKSIGVRQRIPNLSGREAARDEILANAGQLEVARAARLAELRAEMFGQLLVLDKVADQIVLLDARNAEYDELDEVYLAEVDAGSPSLFRLAEIEGERADLERTRVGLVSERISAQARLRDLLGTVPDGIDITPELVVWSGHANAFHAVQVAQESVEIADARIDRAEAAFKADWGAQATYQQRENGANFDGDDWVSFGVTLSVPLWSGRKQEPRLRAAKTDRSAALTDVHAAARSALSQYEALDAQRKAAQESILVLGDRKRAIAQVMEDRLVVYESGAGGYAPIIDGEIALLTLDYQIRAEQARADIATVRMNGLIIIPLDQTGAQP